MHSQHILSSQHTVTPHHTLEEDIKVSLTQSVTEKSRDVGIRTIVVTDEKEFACLKNEWNELAEIAGVPVYSEFEWLYCWWKHFGRHPKRKPFIITEYKDNQLIGIAPFFTGESSIGRFILHRRMYLMGCGTDTNESIGFTKDYGYSDFLDIIAHPEYRKPVADSISQLIQHNIMNVDTVCFTNLTDNSFVINSLLPALGDLKDGYTLAKTDVSPFLSVPDSLETYFRQVGPASRRRRVKKSFKSAGVKYTLEYANTPEQVQETADKLVEMHSDRWNKMGYPGAFYDRRHLQFVKEMTDHLFRKNRLWLNFTKDEHGISAARLAIVDDHSVYDWLSGYDESSPASKYRPGLGLLGDMINRSIRSGLRTVEFLRGDERYKYDFTSEERTVWRVEILLRKARFFSIQKALHILAALHYRIKRETLLLNIQRRQKGLFKMLYGYLKFRFKSLRKDP